MVLPQGPRRLLEPHQALWSADRPLRQSYWSRWGGTRNRAVGLRPLGLKTSLDQISPALFSLLSLPLPAFSHTVMPFIILTLTRSVSHPWRSQPLSISSSLHWYQRVSLLTHPMSFHFFPMVLPFGVFSIPSLHASGCFLLNLIKL